MRGIMGFNFSLPWHTQVAHAGAQVLCCNGMDLQPCGMMRQRWGRDLPVCRPRPRSGLWRAHLRPCRQGKHKQTAGRTFVAACSTWACPAPLPAAWPPPAAAVPGCLAAFGCYRQLHCQHDPTCHSPCRCGRGRGPPSLTQHASMSQSWTPMHRSSRPCRSLWDPCAMIHALNHCKMQTILLCPRHHMCLFRHMAVCAFRIMLVCCIFDLAAGHEVCLPDHDETQARDGEQMRVTCRAPVVGRGRSRDR